MRKEMHPRAAHSKKEPATRPWFIASVGVTLLLIGLLAWHLFFSLNLLDTFKNRELAIERSSWQLLKYAETMKMATWVSALSGNLKWRDPHDRAETKLRQTLGKIPELTRSGRISRGVARIETYLDNTCQIEHKAFALVGQAEKKMAHRLLAGWAYTKNRRNFEETVHRLVDAVQARIQNEVALQQKRALLIISIAAGCLALLIFLWSVTIRSWKAQIREKNQAEADLLESEAKYRLIFENTPLGILHFDPQGRITACNDLFVAGLGARREQLIGLDILKLPNADIVTAVKNAIAGEHGFYTGWYHSVITQSAIRVRAFFAPLTDRNGETYGGVGIVEDITEHKRIEEEKFRLEQQYRQAQKVESIGRLAGGVAHDLNNLLSPILGYAELLSMELKPEDNRRKSADQILYAGSRARDLVRKLLAFGRKQTLEYAPVDMNKALADFERLLRRTIREDIEIRIASSPDIPTVMADIGQIEQVILNLAINSADAMPDGGRIIIETHAAYLDESYAAARPGVQPGPYLMLAVSDTGCGMDEETRALVFEPFFSTKGEMGTGLGLSTVYGIVKQHGGNIWAYSEPQQGTTIKIYLPAAEQDATTKDPAPEHKVPSSCKGTETLLLAEDDPQVRELAESVLQRQGYTVLAVENADRALEIMDHHSNPVHLLLTDVIMPEMNGRELFNRIAAVYPGLRVLYMSGYTEDVIAARGILEEGVAFLQKPFSVQELTAKVREVLDQEPGGGEPP